ncbi:MAG: Smr/MutS family protein, partial [Acidobacteriota bacterium]
DSDLDDQQAFRHAMDEVRPLKGSTRRLRRQARNGTSHPGRIPSPGAALDDFMAAPDFDWSYAPGYIEGGRPNRAPELTERLRRGDYSVQAQLDLHGLTRQEAFRKLEDFLHGCVLQGLTCVRVIHGSGKHSPSGRPILKESLRKWFTQKRLGRYVVAYSSARPADGGSGAVYVLLASPA